MLGEDEATCSPDLAKISISCSPTELLIEIDECVYVGAEENVTLSFHDEMCSSTNQNGSLTLTTSLGKSLKFLFIDLLFKLKTFEKIMVKKFRPTLVDFVL